MQNLKTEDLFKIQTHLNPEYTAAIWQAWVCFFKMEYRDGNFALFGRLHTTHSIIWDENALGGILNKQYYIDLSRSGIKNLS